MSIETMAFVLGGALIAAGVFGGGLEIKELKLPQIAGTARAVAAMVGIAFVVLALAINQKWIEQKKEANQPTPSENTKQSGVFKQPDQSPNPSPAIKIVRDQLFAKAGEFNLGSPHTKTPEPQQTPGPRNEGYLQQFERGYVYWSPTTGAHAVYGDIFNKWAELKWEQGLLGFPITDELSTPDRRGRFNHFQDGSIYWTP